MAEDGNPVSWVAIKSAGVLKAWIGIHDSIANSIVKDSSDVFVHLRSLSLKDSQIWFFYV